jgi:hypothetical protein
LRLRFCQLEIGSRIQRDVRRLLARFVTGSFVGDRGNSSVGRAQPCQGWGRGFESRFPLHFLSGSVSCVRERAPAHWFVLLRSGGETGRRKGLKIPWDKFPCGFDPRPEHPLSLAASRVSQQKASSILEFIRMHDREVSLVQILFAAENLATYSRRVQDAAA